MPGIRVVTDSASDLPAALADELRITIVPLTFRFGSEEFVDRQDLTSAEFWRRCDSSPTLPETAAPSPGAFEQTFRQLAAEGAEGIVCVNLSSELSATMRAAELAAESVADTVPVRVIDSRSVSLGQGQIAAAAARLAAAGKGLDDVAGGAADVVPRTRVFASLDTLENLKKGGRIGGAKAMLATMLSFKPVIEVRDGTVHEAAKPRTRSRSLAYLVDKIKEHGSVEQLAVIHAEAADLEDFLDQVGAVYPRDRIVVGDVGGVIGTHAGRGAIGVTFQVTA
jgi:DegV family protein with EDD domain